MERSTGWYSGYLLGLAHRGDRVLSDEDRKVLDEASRHLHALVRNDSRATAAQPAEQGGRGSQVVVG